MPLMGLLIDWTQLRKESELEGISIESSKIEKQSKENKNWKNNVRNEREREREVEVFLEQT